MRQIFPPTQVLPCILASLTCCLVANAAEKTETACYEARVARIYEEIHPRVFIEQKLAIGKLPGERWVETYIPGDVAKPAGLILCKNCEQLGTENSVLICNVHGTTTNTDRFGSWPVNYQLEVDLKIYRTPTRN